MWYSYMPMSHHNIWYNLIFNMHESLAHKIPEDLLPANVQITSNTIILLCTSPRHQTARTYHELSTAYERPTPTTFKQQLEALPTQL